ncbi:hypothetical protein E2C01_038285 [Portunus trituberculatus]|uniref:Uncharacterized protein n=1 Tax=Portunus trituberculatus TaxID=210409 RepID=A0A5B7FI42_PORTR|nr:hypothetical protein [Portunus trituberculatus]
MLHSAGVSTASLRQRGAGPGEGVDLESMRQQEQGFENEARFTRACLSLVNRSGSCYGEAEGKETAIATVIPPPPDYHH